MGFVVRDSEDTAASRLWSPSSWLIYIFFCGSCIVMGKSRRFLPPFCASFYYAYFVWAELAFN